jgi:PsbP
MHSSTFITLAVTTLLLGSTCFPIAIGQQNPPATTTNKIVFRTFTNFISGFKVLYPSNWITSASSPTDAVFDSEPVKIGEGVNGIRIEVSIRKVDQYLDTQQMVVKNKTAYDYVAPILRDAAFRPIRVNSTSVAGFDAWSVDFMLGTNTFFRDTYMVNNGKLYEIHYMTPPLKVPETLPVLKKMISSFEIIKK